MLSMQVILRKAHPLNRKMDLLFKILFLLVHLTFNIDSLEQDIKKQQNMRAFNYSVPNETSVR